MKTYCTIYLAVIATISTASQSAKIPSLGEQTHFDVEYEFGVHPIRHPIGIPLKALDTLRHEPGLVAACEKAERLSAGQVPAEWFVASQIHLSNGTGRDLIVQPKSDPDSHPSNRCLFGANVGPFWVFVETSTGYKLVLDASGHDLKVLHNRTGGYRDIEVSSETATTLSVAIYKFNGKTYELSSSHSEPI